MAHRGLGATCSLAEGHANHAVFPAANILRLPDASPAGSSRILVPGHTQLKAFYSLWQPKRA